MQKISKWIILVMGFIFILSCARKNEITVKSSSGTATLVVTPADGFCEPNQAVSISGNGFAPGKIPANSVKVGDIKTSHPEIIVSDNGSFNKTEIMIKKELPPGAKDIKIGREEFLNAYTIKPVIIEYMMWGEPNELATVQEYLKKFSEKYSGIEVKILHVTQQYDDKLKTMFASRTPPDIMYIGLENFPSFAQNGVLLDLQPLIERDRKEIMLDDFYPVLMEQFKYKDRYYGIAKDFTTLVLYYNKNVFDKEGLKYPGDKWTWDDFLNACKKLTKDTNNDGQPEQYGFVLETWFQEWASWLWQNGGRIMNDERTRWLLGNPDYKKQNAEALQFLSDLVWKHKVAPNPTVTMDMGTSDMFLTGKVAMCTYGRWMCMRFKHIKDFKWDVAVLPYKKKRAATLFTVCYAIAKETKHPEAAWKLIKFLMSKEGQVLVAESGHAIPSRKSIAESIHFLNAKEIPVKLNSRAFLDSISYARPTPTNPHWVEIQTLLNRQMDWVWQGDKTAVEIIEIIQPEIETLMERYYPPK